MKALLVAGTWGNRGDVARDEWWWPSSAFAQMVRAQGHSIIGVDRPFIWTTNLSGFPWPGAALDRVDWSVGGENLYVYAVPPQCPDKRVPSDELLVIAHSHGLQVALYAFAAGLKGRLISVCGPIREDMMSVARQARPNILRWLHCYSDCDAIQAAGELWDGRLGVVRPHRLADINVDVTPLGHSDMVRDQAQYGLWPGLLAQVNA